ncbi:MAG: hypothetical protein HY289_06040 [Planctomycetes bacterium]|nr:hypothetical protein [Planctomycetota bacterium]
MARDYDDPIPGDAPSRHDGDRDEYDDGPRRSAEAPHDIAAKPMPLQLVGAIILSIFWGGLTLHGSCVGFTRSTMGVISHHNAVWGLERIGGAGEGFYGTLAAGQFFIIILAATLLAAGVLLMMRKSYAKYMAIGAPAAILLVDMGTAVLCLIITSGTFLAQHNFDFLISITFSLIVGGVNAFLLFNQNVTRALN